MAEERRLFYVGLTRAKNKLYLVRAERRSSYGSYEEAVPSRFLDDLPLPLVQQQGMNAGYRRSSYGSQRDERKDRYSRWDAPSPVPAPRPGQQTYGYSAPRPVERKYAPAMRVRHPIWGEGMVIESRVQDGDETLDVIFESVGFKRLVASLANLEIIQGK